jgi:hypothetical protein
VYKFKQFGMSKKLLIHLVASLIIFGLIGLGTYEYLNFNYEITTQKASIDSKDSTIQNLTQMLGNCQTTQYTSKDGHFSLIIPTNVYTKEFEQTDGDFTTGGTYFSFDKNNPESGLLIQYAKPYIEGKGGACLDEEGNGAFKNEIIASQTVEVCESKSSFSAAYFKNPTHDIEYVILINGWQGSNATETQVATFKSIVQTSLSFD